MKKTPQVPNAPSSSSSKLASMLSSSPLSENKSSCGSANHDDLTIARSVLEQEVKGLAALELWLDNQFVQAIEVLASAKGRIILSGMGKSGHIANKIAATFASTGTPAQFVHPGEASHGDLGMVTQDDVVVLLSNSGETKELQDIIYYTQRFSIPLIGIVRRKTSVLVEAATVPLVLPEIAEAADIVAPTTSTTMMLALGDALAVALMKRKGFSHNDFGVLHPGGKLGASFLRVEALMHQRSDLPLVQWGAAMSDAIIEMSAKSFGCVGVVDKDGILEGIITDGDLRRHMSSQLLDQPAHSIMTSKPVTTSSNSLIVEALAIMQERSITNIFVTNAKQEPVGIIHIHDILRAGVT